MLHLLPVTIDEGTLNDIKGSVGQNDVIPIHHTSVQFSVGDQNGRGTIYGLAPSDVPKFLTIAQGSNIRGSDVLVGATIASNFNLVVGSTIQIGEKCATVTRPVVRVAGILQARGIAADGVNVDNGMIVDDTWYTNEFGGLDQYDQVNVVMADVSQINQTEAAINAKVNRNSDVVRVSDASSRLSTIASTLGTITTFIMAIGGISLVVAAVSIFNVMMMSVKERVQEIGILLSIGTEKGEVRRMFLYEALILGLIGAVVGGIMELYHRVLCRKCHDRYHPVFLHLGQPDLHPLRHDHRCCGMCSIRDVSCMGRLEHGPDRCPRAD